MYMIVVETAVCSPYCRPECTILVLVTIFLETAAKAFLCSDSTFKIPSRSWVVEWRLPICIELLLNISNKKLIYHDRPISEVEERNCQHISLTFSGDTVKFT